MSLFPDVEVWAGQTNRVPEPKEQFIIFNPIGKVRLSTNRRTYVDTSPVGKQLTINPMEMVFQIDFYGQGSGERAHIFNTLFQDFNGYDSFPENIKPLFCGDPSQMPLTNGEKEFEERWRAEAHIQYNAVVQSAMQFFDAAEVDIQQPSNFIKD